MSNIREKLYNWGEKSTFHAIPNITVNDRYLVKAIWLICLLASTGVCFNNIILNLIAFSKYEVDTVYEILQDSDVEFPTVSFCNMQICGLNYDNKKYVDMYMQEKYNNTGNLSSDAYAELIQGFDLKNLMHEARNMFLKSYNKTELDRIFSSKPESIKDYLISCEFGEASCDENDFEFFKLNEFHKCFKFNSGKLFNGSSVPTKKSSRFGKFIMLNFMQYRCLCRKEAIYFYIQIHRLFPKKHSFKVNTWRN